MNTEEGVADASSCEDETDIHISHSFIVSFPALSCYTPCATTLHPFAFDLTSSYIIIHLYASEVLEGIHFGNITTVIPVP